MTATITPLEHWCTDEECKAEVIEVRGGAKKIRRWKLSAGAIAWGFDTKEEALKFAVVHGYTVE